jgi:hypothetical protein
MGEGQRVRVNFIVITSLGQAGLNALPYDDIRFFSSLIEAGIYPAST